MTSTLIASSQPHPEATSTAFANSPLYNADLAPTTRAQRTWTVWSYAALWISMSACIPTYQLAAGMIKAGENWWEAVLTIFAGSVIVLVPMVLNGFAGTRYGIPFPVYCRASFGTIGANLPAMVRAVIACGWFGIQTWIGGTAVLAIAAVFHPAWADPTLHTVLGVTGPQFIAFLAFWAVNMAVIFAGIDSIRILLDIKAPLLVVLGLVLLAWAGHTYGFHSTFDKPSAFAAPTAFWSAFFPLLTGVVGFWATVSLNIPDFTRYAKSQRDQALGQAIGLPFTMALYAFIGIAVTLATGNGDPIALVSTFHSKWVIVPAEAAIVLATLATNIAANVVSPANDFANLAPRFIGFRTGGLLTGLVGIAILPWKLYADPHGYIFTWLIGSSSLLGAVGGVMIADFWVLRHGRLSVAALFDPNGKYAYTGGVNIRAVLALVLAVAPCLPGFLHQVMPSMNSVPMIFDRLYTYAWFVSFALSFVLYLLFMLGSKQSEPIEALA